MLSFIHVTGIFFTSVKDCQDKCEEVSRVVSRLPQTKSKDQTVLFGTGDSRLHMLEIPPK